MKKITILAVALIIAVAIGYPLNNEPEPFIPQSISTTTCLPQVDIINTNSVSAIANNFEMSLFSDKEVYKTTDIIQIQATLKYVGNKDTITIWHGDPYMVFSITDSKDFNSNGIVYDILTSTTLEKDKLYSFDYQKNGGWDADDPMASFWEDFYTKKELSLPKGEYTVTLNGDFFLGRELVDSPSNLLCQLKIKVEQ